MTINQRLRLHPLWPQNKWLHTPPTTDYGYSRQDRWIQTDLAFTLAKNATKPNPFEIIPLQTARKDTIGRLQKRWREQLWLWRRNGSKGPVRDVDYDDDPCRINVPYSRVSQRTCSEILLLWLQIKKGLYIIWFHSYVVWSNYAIWQPLLKGNCACSSLCDSTVVLST